MENSDIDVEKYVDHYLLNHTRPVHTSSLCHTCNTLHSHSCPSHLSHPINRNDIDLLELMNPNMTPDHYMSNIMKLYKQETNLKSREQNNKPMQLNLTTKRVIWTDDIKEQSDCSSERGSQMSICMTKGERSMLSEQHKVDKTSQEHLQRLRDECYLGLGRLIIERKEKKNRVELDKANYHTRQYLLPHAKQQMERLQKEAGKSRQIKFYIPANANSQGINFEPDEMPAGLDRVLDNSKYREVICTINEIIQRTVFNHKRGVVANKNVNPIYVWFMAGLLVLVSLLLGNSLKINSLVLEMCCLVGSLCLILFILMMSCHEFHKRIDYKPLLQRVSSGISEYLQYLNSRPASTLQWSIPHHLYWIEIKVSQDRHKFLGNSFVS